VRAGGIERKKRGRENEDVMKEGGRGREKGVGKAKGGRGVFWGGEGGVGGGGWRKGDREGGERAGMVCDEVR